MAGISAGAKAYIKAAMVRSGIAAEYSDQAIANAPASYNLSLGVTPHDPVALDLVDALRVSVGFPSQGRTVVAQQLDLARTLNTPDHLYYPPVAAQVVTNFLKNV